jgi:hypothetical protein
MGSVYAKLRDAAVHRALYGTPSTYTNKKGDVVTKLVHDNRLLIDVIDRFLPEIASRKDDARQALEGGIIVTFQIGDGPPQLPAGADLELEATEELEAPPE